jgi:serpin B
MIDGILSELSEDARMVVLNTVAFEGKWANEFRSEITTQRDFTAYDGSKKKVPMMVDSDSYQYFEMNGGQGFVKYYKSDVPKSGVAFVGILPPADTSADAYISSLTAKDFANAWSSKESREVILRLPKFDYDYSVDMGDLLQEMGIRTAFTDNADFSRMANPTLDTPGLKISKVLHKTHIELDESGTRAAAATAIVMDKATSCLGDSPIELTFDRPFVYALVDTATGMPLFIGEVVKL